MLIDSHAHIDFEAYQDDREEVIKRCQEKGMRVVNVGAQYATSKFAVELAQKYDFFYATVGLHPIHVYDDLFNTDEYQKLIDGNKRVVAVGECGFDYFYIKESARSFAEVKAKQKEVLIKHIELAIKNNLPLMLHGRNGKNGESSYKDILEVLKEQDCHNGMIHCYGGDMEEVKLFLEQGFYIGFTGIITFKKKVEELQEIAKYVPMDRLIIETDAPYLSPEPHRGKRNEPIYVEFVARKIAELKNMSYDDVVEQTGQNSINLFKL
jgi:TatD DNase family protein